VLPFLKVFLI